MEAVNRERHATMILHLVLLALLIPAAAFAQATINAKEITGEIAAIPYKGMLYSDDLQTALTYNCTYDAHLACTFVETSLRKKAEPKDWDKQMAELQKMMPDLQKGLDRECAPDYLNNILAVIKGEKAAESREEKEATHSIREMDTAERAKHAERISKLCKTRDFMEPAREGFDRETRTCAVSSHSYTLHFYAPSAQEMLWVSKDSPDEECATKVSARFENQTQPDGYPGNWTLTVKNLRPADKQPPSFMSRRCQKMAGERAFTLRYDVKTRHQCEYIVFEPQ
jgi:hypothetical protein